MTEFAQAIRAFDAYNASRPETFPEMLAIGWRRG